MIAFTRFGVSFGLACSISATVPATTGDAMLVPDRLRYGVVGGVPPSKLVNVLTTPPSRNWGFRLYSVLPGTESDAMPTPVATTSGLALKSTAVGPREL